MINSIFFIIAGLSAGLLAFYWYASYSTKSGFAVDENKNNIPDSWERFSILFKLKNFVILLMGMLLGYLFHFITI